MQRLLFVLRLLLVLLELCKVLLHGVERPGSKATSTKASKDDGDQVWRHTSCDGITQHPFIDSSLLEP